MKSEKAHNKKAPLAGKPESNTFFPQGQHFFEKFPLPSFRKASYQLLKIEEGPVLSVPSHTGGQHPVRRLVFPEALGEHPAQMELVQPPLRRRRERLRAVAVAGVSPVDPAAQLRAAPAVEVVQHRLADELSLQPDGEVHRQVVPEIPPGHLEEAPLLHRPLPKEHYDLIQYGEYYRLLALSDKQCTVWETADPEGREALVSAVYHHVEGNAGPVMVKIQGLKAEAYYQVRLHMEDAADLPEKEREWFTGNLPYGYHEGEKVTGAALRQCGLIIPDALQEFQAWQIHIVEAL